MVDEILAGVLKMQHLLLEGDFFALFVYLFNHGGWLLLYFFLFEAVFHLHHIYDVLEFKAKMKWVFLAIDVPKNNEQTPRAAENIFAHLAGAHSTRDLVEKYWLGETQRWFSFEIVSVGGYIQFVVGTEKKHRDLVEAAIYAQYPDAELTEIEDYCKWAPGHYPHPQYKIWGLEYRPVNKDYTNSIRMWDDFEDKVTGTYKDPMAALLENFTRIGQGEQLWMQLLVRPIGQAWVKKGVERINKIMGVKDEHSGHQSLGQKALSAPLTGLEMLARHAMTGQVGEEAHDNKRPEIKFMNPVEFETIKGVVNKVSRIGFHAKIRFVYIAEHGVFNKNRVHHGITGAMKQFTDELGNGLKPDTKHTQVTAHYLFEDWRKNHKRGELIRNYKRRDVWQGYPRFILNVRELATIWHFPMLEVKTPALKRSEVRTSRPPTELPFEFKGGKIIEPLTSTTPPPQAIFKGGFGPFQSRTEEGGVSLSGHGAGHGGNAVVEQMGPVAAHAVGAAQEIVGKITPHGGGLTEAKGAPPGNLPFVD
ncbi:MAG TPA: hypothetical protein DDW36_02145 [Candidatus Magasanikbacteria bacterium]|nr:hypothetical protein [Candidatus Magasanikbacteria bacterium]